MRATALTFALLVGIGCSDAPVSPAGDSDSGARAQSDGGSNAHDRIADAGPSDAHSLTDSPDTGAPPEPGEDAGAGECPREPAAADRVRYLVLSHPFADDPTTYEVFSVDLDGEVEAIGETFHMGRAFTGDIVFTPDGVHGFVAQDEGTIGAFRILPDGSVSVVHEAYRSEFFAERVVLHPDGNRLFAIDSQWEANGGAVVELEIACDGTLSEVGRTPAHVADTIAFLDANHMLVAARTIDSSPAGTDAHLLDVERPLRRNTSGHAFDDDDASISDAALLPNGEHWILANNALFTEHVVSVLSISDEAIQRVASFELSAPDGIIASPFGNAVLILGGESDAYHALRYDSSETPSWWMEGEIDYSGSAPELSSVGSVIERGSLRGMVFAAELLGVRRLRFAESGAITDLGRVYFGSGRSRIIGAMGIQP